MYKVSIIGVCFQCLSLSSTGIPQANCNCKNTKKQLSGKTYCTFIMKFNGYGTYENEEQKFSIFREHFL